MFKSRMKQFTSFKSLSHFTSLKHNTRLTSFTILQVFVGLLPGDIVLVIAGSRVGCEPEGVDDALRAEVEAAALLDDEVAAADRLQQHLRLRRDVDL